MDLGEGFKPIKCPKCKIVVTHLVSLTDDGDGERICVACKRKLRKERYIPCND